MPHREKKNQREAEAQAPEKVNSWSSIQITLILSPRLFSW